MATEQELQEQNELRCFASEIIIKLYEANNISQLELLKLQIERSLEELQLDADEKKP